MHGGADRQIRPYPAPEGPGLQGRVAAVALLLVAALACSAGSAADQQKSAPAPEPPVAATTPPPVAATPGTAPADFDGTRAWEHLRQQVAFGPRPSGSPALARTRAYITQQLTGYGLTVREQAFRAETPNGPIPMVNLTVTLPGRRPDRILLTGHYDTKLFREGRFVGASDGASSGAMLIELARVLNTRPREFTYELVWFDGEEAVCREWTECRAPDGGPDNTYGSRYYVRAARTANTLSSIKAMILFDMIGARNLTLKRDGSSTPWLVDLFWSTARRVGHGASFSDENYPISGDDHFPFMEAGIPAIDLIDFFEQWHTPEDDLDHVEARSLQIVGEVTLAALPEIERRLAQ
jgi:hypothetical protein